MKKGSDRPSILVLDAEILNIIKGRDEPEIDGLVYVRPDKPGDDPWRCFEQMGLTTVCTYSYISDRYRVFGLESLGSLQSEICSHRTVATFNGQNFDLPLLDHWGVGLDGQLHYDLLREVWAAAGFDPDVYDHSTHRFFGLHAMAMANLGEGKNGNGALAPQLWQQGNYCDVIDYCLNDVRLLKLLLDKVIAGERLIDPRPKDALDLLRPAFLL